MATPNDRLVELKQTRTDRIYKEAVLAAGFDNSDDYDAWLVLEELRKLTLSERKAARGKDCPLDNGITSVTINPRVNGFSLRQHYYDGAAPRDDGSF